MQSKTTNAEVPADAPMKMRCIVAACMGLYKLGIYCISFTGPAWLLMSVRHLLNATGLIALTLVGWWVSGLTFLAVLVLTKKLLVGDLREVGCGTVASPLIRKWFPAAMLTVTLDNSPFRSFTTGMSLLGPWFYRNMGAKMPNSVLIGGRSLIFDPWFLEVGENVNIGTGATILGHLGHGPDVELGKVVIESGAIVGVNSVILPGVQIGRNSCVAAGAVVVKGTKIGNNEVWGGIPAKKISSIRGCYGNEITSLKKFGEE